MDTADEKKHIEKLAKGILPRGLEKIHLNTAGIDISPKSTRLRFLKAEIQLGKMFGNLAPPPLS